METRREVLNENQEYPIRAVVPRSYPEPVAECVAITVATTVKLLTCHVERGRMPESKHPCDSGALAC